MRAPAGGAVMDDTEWISREAAAEWLVREYGLSDGAAKKQLRDAEDSGMVKMRARFGNLPEWVPVLPDTMSKLPTALFLHSRQENLPDLRWWIAKQIDKPAAL